MNAKASLTLRRRQRVVVAQSLPHIVLARNNPDPTFAAVPDLRPASQRTVSRVGLVHRFCCERVEVSDRRSFLASQGVAIRGRFVSRNPGHAVYPNLHEAGTESKPVSECHADKLPF